MESGFASSESNVWAMIPLGSFQYLFNRLIGDLTDLIQVGAEAVCATEIAVSGQLQADEKIVHQKTLTPGATGDACAATGGPGTDGAPVTLPTFSFIRRSFGLTYRFRSFRLVFLELVFL